jgi:hypothetical protein
MDPQPSPRAAGLDSPVMGLIAWSAIGYGVLLVAALALCRASARADEGEDRHVLLWSVSPPVNTAVIEAARIRETVPT